MADNTTTRIPYQKKNPIPYQQQPIQVYQPVRSCKKKKTKNQKTKIQKTKVKKTKNNVIYETPCDCVNGFFIIIFFIAGVGAFSIMIAEAISSGQSQKLLYAIFPLIFVIFAIILGSCRSLYFIINISSTSGIIIINKKKLCFCFSKQEVMKINELQQVIVQTDHNCFHRSNGRRNNSFEVIFRLSNGRKVEGCSGIMDKDGEGRRAFLIIRNALPSRIVFDGNFAY